MHIHTLYCRITVLLVVALFIAGAALNVDQERQPDADGHCYHAPGSSLFAAATVLTVAATSMQIASYILLQVTTTPTSSTKPPMATQQPELAMGQPVVEPEPQQTAEEVAAVAVGGQKPPPPSAPVPSQATEPTSQVWSLEPMEGRLISLRCSFIIKIAMPTSMYVIVMPASIYVQYMHGLFVQNQSGFLYGVVRYRMIKSIHGQKALFLKHS